MNIKDLITFVEDRKIFSRENHILLAVSGGIDSMVMAHMFHESKFQIALAHCNFGLRAQDSDDDAEFVNKQALHWHVPFYSVKFDTTTVAARKGVSIQMAARDLRYEWFEKIRQEHQFDYVATAHHLDDQVETFLINLIRGTGIAGLHGIPVKNGTIIRPMMFVYRKDIEQYAVLNKISYRIDLSNNGTKYLRNRLRHEIIPLFCTINPEFTHVLTESIRLISDFEQIGKRTLDDWCRQVLKSKGKDYLIDIGHLLQTAPVEPYAWAALAPFGFNETQVSNIIRCLGKENRRIFRSSTHRVVKERTQLVISPIEPMSNDKPYKIGPFAHGKKVSKPIKLLFKKIGQVKAFEISTDANIANIDFDKLSFPLMLRRWQPGDAFYPLGMKKKKKLSDFFIDQKFSMKEKEQTWLLCSGNDIAWIVGHRIDHRFRVTSATREVLSIVL